MVFRELVDKEHYETKERMVKETCGTYVLLYLFNGLIVFMMSMFGFSMSKEDGNIIIILVLIIFVTLDGWGFFIKWVREGSKRVNIFEKYKFVPVNLKQLIAVKMVVFSRYTGIQIIIGQIIAVLIRIWNPDHVKQENVWMTFMPFYIGVVLYLYEYFSMVMLSRKVLTHSV